MTLLELKEYGCSICVSREYDEWLISYMGNRLIKTTFLDLFTALGAREPNGNLLLDASSIS
jgi:hypothetical protein